MPYLPVKLVKGKHYKVYVESKEKMIPSKAHLLSKALGKALKEEIHVEEIDFIPSVFVLQTHGWVSPEADPFKSAEKMKKFQLAAIKAGKDPIRVVEKKGMGKWHYDLRIWKLTAPTWFGVTFFSAPWKGTAEKKVQGTIKGAQAWVPEGKKLEKWMIEEAQKKAPPGEPIVERKDRLFWMKVKQAYWPPGAPANPTKKQWAYMMMIDYGPAVLHRREADFIDCTFLGNLLKGRYYDRLVARKLSPEELPVTYKKKVPYGLFYYFWKAKKGQFPLDLMEKVARGDIELSPVEQFKVLRGVKPAKKV